MRSYRFTGRYSENRNYLSDLRNKRNAYDRIRQIAAAGLTILVVEQNTVLALAVADRGYVLENGRVVLEGSAAELKQDVRVREAYLGR